MCVLCDSGESLANTAARMGPLPWLHNSPTAPRSISATPLKATAPRKKNVPGRSVDDDLRRIQGARRLIIKGAIVLSLDPNIGDFPSADILIENGKIKDIRPSIEVSDSDLAVIDAKHRIVVPGFVDTHSHSYQGLLRGLLPSGVHADYDREIQNRITMHYTPDDAYAGVLITALGLLESGTTTLVDISQVAHSPEHSDANIKALQDAGARAVFAFSRGIGPKAQYPGDLKRMLTTYFSSKDQLLTPALAVSRDPKTYAMAREFGVHAVLHIRIESDSLIALHNAGVIRDGDEFIHCTHLSQEAWNVIRDSGGRTSHSVPLEMAMGHGTPAIQEALNNGARPSLSGDHATTVGMDMFGMMRAAFNMQRVVAHQRNRDKQENIPPLVSPKQILEFATINGARVANLDHRIGSLTPGKDADLLMLKADRLDVWPVNNAYAAVVNQMNTAHVETIFVAGKPKKWRGVLTGVDHGRIMDMAQRARDAVVSRAGFEANIVA